MENIPAATGEPGSVDLSLVVPFYNEEEGVEPFLNRARDLFAKASFTGEVVAVDDGSSDRTFEILRARAREWPALRVVRLSRNFGHQHALMAGFDHAQGKAVVTIDGDLQDPPEVVPELYAKFLAGNDVVQAVRTSRAGEPFWRLLVIRLFYRILHQISRMPVYMDAGDFRLLSRRAVEHLRRMRDAHPYIRGLAAWVGFSQTAVPYDRAPRTVGQSKYGLFKLIQLGWNGVSMLSHLPLRLATGLGLLCSLASVGMAVFIAVKRIAYGVAPQGWTSLMVVILLLSGVLMLQLGVLGEYVGRIHDQVKFRPQYIVRETENLEGPAKPPGGDRPA